MGRAATVAIFALLVYLGGYAGFRQTSQEVWQKDGQTYVIFPAGNTGRALYYAWRPVAYIDGALTGMHFHIGPHP